MDTESYQPEASNPDDSLAHLCYFSRVIFVGLNVETGPTANQTCSHRLVHYSA